MQTILESFRDGPLYWVADNFKPMTPLTANAFPMSLMSTAEGCAHVLASYLAANPEDASQRETRRARISMWSQWYFANLLPSWVIVSLSHNWLLPIAPDKVFLTLQENGLPNQLYLEGNGKPLASTLPMARFEEMIELHLRPICLALAELSELKAGIYWSNAGVRVNWGLQQAALINVDISDGLQLLNARTLRHCAKNPLFQPVRPENPQDANSPLFRRQCCLRHELSDHAMCPSCPLLLAEKHRRTPQELS